MTSPMLYARSRWNHIYNGISMGGHYYDPNQDEGIRAVTVHTQFQGVVSLYLEDWSGPSNGVRHITYEIPDGRLTPGEVNQVKSLGRRVADMTRTGRQILVRCEAGYNRSGLVIGYALIRLGKTPEEAIALIRARRSPHALCNPHFVQHLMEEK